MEKNKVQIVDVVCPHCNNKVHVEALLDKLKDLFTKQKDFDDRVQSDSRLPSWSEPEFIQHDGFKIKNKYIEGQRRINALLNFMQSEVSEAKEALGFLANDQVKWWKNTIKWDHFMEETIDILHVLLSIWLNINATSDDVYNEYKRKWAINHSRQDNKY